MGAKAALVGIRACYPVSGIALDAHAIETARRVRTLSVRITVIRGLSALVHIHVHGTVQTRNAITAVPRIALARELPAALHRNRVDKRTHVFTWGIVLEPERARAGAGSELHSVLCEGGFWRGHRQQHLPVDPD
eukprot:2643454-Rhodomonas_salina.1